jgi:adenosylhomocysteine nucleosidase
MPRIAIIAALRREVDPLISGPGWQQSNAVRTVYGSYRKESVLVVCGGIGSAAARKSAEDAVRAFQPELMVSAGIVGALVPELKTGAIMMPQTVIDSGRGTRIHCEPVASTPGTICEGTLVSASGIPGPEGKRLLSGQYQADVVDMEAGSVAAVAQANRIPFVAIKAISDEFDFPMPDLEPFVDEHGRFRTGRFVMHVAPRPSLWKVTARMASDSSRATQELCRALRAFLKLQMTKPEPAGAPDYSSTRLEQSSR